MRRFSSLRQLRHVLEKRAQDAHTVPDSTRAAGEVGDKDLAPGAGQAPGEGRIGGLLLTSAPDQLREARCGPIQNRRRRLGRDVPWAEPRSPRRQDDVHLTSVGPSKENGNDSIRPVGHDLPKGQGMTFPPTPFFQQSPALVGTLAPAAGVGDREDPHPQGGDSPGTHRRTEPSV